MTAWREAAKAALGSAAALAPQCRYDRCLFVFGHMRCGSTALSNVLCSHPEVSGFGETHIAYRSRAALGVLALSQLRRGTLKAGSRYLFDKLLHGRYDDDPPAAFFAAAAVFVIREPADTVRSIRKLFAASGSGEYTSDALAARYYEARLRDLQRLWRAFPAPRRVGITYAALAGDPDAVLARISTLIGGAALSNRYDPATVPVRPGSGDPLSAPRFTSIVEPAAASSVGSDAQTLMLPSDDITRLKRLYLETVRLFAEENPVTFGASVTP